MAFQYCPVFKVVASLHYILFFKKFVFQLLFEQIFINDLIISLRKLFYCTVTNKISKCLFYLYNK